LGLSNRDVQSVNFYYANDGSAVTITGDTNIKGHIMAPANGFIYGQMKSVFFSGEEISPALISMSDAALPAPRAESKTNIDALFSLNADSEIESDFSSILVGNEFHFDAETSLDNDAIVVGDKIVIEEGFFGTGQFFAKDSIIVNDGVRLLYPSGIYSRKYAKLNPDSVVEGYVIVDNESSSANQIDYVQSRTAKVRGLLYVNGNAMLQGIVSGPCYIKKAIYYAPEGYYRNMIYDASVLENREMALPLWVGEEDKRETINRLE
jgi:hypothetical protein